MTETQENQARGMLANDEVSDDTELFDHFTTHLAIEPREALGLVGERDNYLKGVLVA